MLISYSVSVANLSIDPANDVFATEYLNVFSISGPLFQHNLRPSPSYLGNNGEITF